MQSRNGLYWVLDWHCNQQAVLALLRCVFPSILLWRNLSWSWTQLCILKLADLPSDNSTSMKTIHGGICLGKWKKKCCSPQSPSAPRQHSLILPLFGTCKNAAYLYIVEAQTFKEAGLVYFFPPCFQREVCWGPSCIWSLGSLLWEKGRAFVLQRRACMRCLSVFKQNSKET